MPSLKRSSDFDLPIFPYSLENWPFSVWNNFATYEDELERRFRYMEKQMDRAQRDMMRNFDRFDKIFRHLSRPELDEGEKKQQDA